MSAPSEQPQQAQSSDDYIIWPHENITPEDISKTEKAIRSVIDSKEPIRNYTSQLDGLRCWFIQLTPEQLEEVEKLKGVSFCPGSVACVPTDVLQVKGVQKDGPDPDQTDD